MANDTAKAGGSYFEDRKLRCVPKNLETIPKKIEDMVKLSELKVRNMYRTWFPQPPSSRGGPKKNLNNIF